MLANADKQAFRWAALFVTKFNPLFGVVPIFKLSAGDSQRCKQSL